MPSILTIFIPIESANASWWIPASTYRFFSLAGNLSSFLKCKYFLISLAVIFTWWPFCLTASNKPIATAVTTASSKLPLCNRWADIREFLISLI